MLLSGQTVSTFQNTSRRYALQREYRVARWRPKELLERAINKAVYSLSNGGKDSAESATTYLLEQCRRPGLETQHDPYILARDFCAIIGNVCESLSRTALLSLQHPSGPRPHDDNLWQLSCTMDESGTLHRWVCVEKLTEDAKWRELHSWAVFGDCCAAQQGMWLHIVEIGRQRNGHQETPWARAYKHPVIPNKIRFRKVDGSPLEGGWKPVWHQNSSNNDPKTWVDLMQADGVALIHHIQIREPSKEDIERFYRDMSVIASRMETVVNWQEEPMCRHACEVPYVCPWQPVCYGSGKSPESLGFIKIGA